MLRRDRVELSVDTPFQPIPHMINNRARKPMAKLFASKQISNIHDHSLRNDNRP